MEEEAANNPGENGNINIINTNNINNINNIPQNIPQNPQNIQNPPNIQNPHIPQNQLNNPNEISITDDYEESSRFALKIVLLLSLLLVALDISEVYFTFLHLKETAITHEPEIFESCIKYHIISQIIFTLFATFAGVSACFMSIGLLINYEFFANKAINTFLHMNYLIFGPYLLAASLLGYMNYDNVVYNCERGNSLNKYLNVSTLVALNICFFISVTVTVSFSFVWGFWKMVNSVRMRDNGNYYLGRIFWRYVLSRDRAPSEVEMRNMNRNNAENNMNRNGNVNNENNIHNQDNTNNNTNYYHNMDDPLTDSLNFHNNNVII